MDNNLLLQALNKTDTDIRELRSDIESLRIELQGLNAFKFKVYGIASFLSAAIGFTINYFKN